MRLRQRTHALFEDVRVQRFDALAGDSEATRRALRAGLHALGAAYAETAETGPSPAAAGGACAAPGACRRLGVAPGTLTKRRRPSYAATLLV